MHCCLETLEQGTTDLDRVSHLAPHHPDHKQVTYKHPHPNCIALPLRTSAIAVTVLQSRRCKPE